jgi:hypothetical protein
MKLDIWIAGNLEIMHGFFFSSYVEKWLTMATCLTIFVILQKYWTFFMKLKIWTDGNLEIIHIILILTIREYFERYFTKQWRPRQNFWFPYKFFIFKVFTSNFIFMFLTINHIITYVTRLTTLAHKLSELPALKFELRIFMKKMLFLITTLFLNISTSNFIGSF